MRRVTLAAILLATTLALGPSALAVPGDITLASTSDDGTKSNAGVGSLSLSADGTRVAFSSSSTNLDPADTDSVSDIYVKDLITGDITLASTSDAGIKGNGGSLLPSLSADGTRVAFESSATNLDPGDTGLCGSEFYVKDLVTGDITLASTSDTGTPGDCSSGGLGLGDGPSLSADGSRVAFSTFAINLDPTDTDSLVDIYVKDLVTGDITLASSSDTGSNSNDHASGSSLSADGNVVAFSSLATNLDPGSKPIRRGVFVKDLITGDITLASTSDTGTVANNPSSSPSLSADGTRVAFNSGATNLDSADPDSASDVYVKDLITGDITLASTLDPATVEPDLSVNPSLSADGTRVAFETTDDPKHFNRLIYVKDLLTGDITLASTSDTGSLANGVSFSPSLSAVGSAVAFWSLATNLDPADTDALSDVYVKELSEP
jgi:hypothetical protein